jgi:methyl-accepting chemotaxis protein
MALSSTSFTSKTPLQDRSCELGMDIILKCDSTLELNQMLIGYNSELDDLRSKRHIAIHNLTRITARETQIDALQDVIHQRINELQIESKDAARQINQITEDTKRIIKRFEFTNCNVSIA